MADADATEALAAAADGANGAESREPNQGTQDSSSSTSDSSAGGNWLDKLPSEHREYIGKKNWTEPNQVVQGYVELERYARKSVQDMTPEERERFYKKLGDRPESPDGYELSDVKLPEALGYDDETAKTFKSKAHELGLTKQQAKTLDEWAKRNALQQISNAQRAQTRKLEQYETQLREEWGSEYDANENGILELARKFGNEEVVKFLKGPGRHPAMRKFLQAIRETMLEDTLETGGPVTEQQRSGLFDWSNVPGGELLRGGASTQRR